MIGPLFFRTCSLALLLCLISFGSEAQVAEDKPFLLKSVCQITQQQKELDGKIVRVRATFIGGFELSGIQDPSHGSSSVCRVVWLEYAPSDHESSAKTTPRMTLQRDENLQKWQQLVVTRMYPRDPRDSCRDCFRYRVTAVVTGRVDWMGEPGSAGQIVIGFGHLGAYRARLVLQSVTDIQATDLKDTYDPRLYSPDPPPNGPSR